MIPSLSKALHALKQGKMIIVVDDETRENEGDLIFAARAATSQKIAFMLREARGLMCVSMDARRASDLQLAPIVSEEQNTEATKCNFLVSTDYAFHRDPAFNSLLSSVKTGVSFTARAQTIRALADPKKLNTNFVRPGHVFPLRAHEWGVLKRPGHTEAVVDLCTIAGIDPAVGVLCEILKPDGTIARLPFLQNFSKRFRLPLIHIADIVEYRKFHEKLVERVAKASLPTIFGSFVVYAYREVINGKAHVVLVKGRIQKSKPILVRVHSRCLTGDAFLSLRCDCNEQLHAALKHIAKRGSGILVYLNQEGRDIGIIEKIKSYALQDRGYDTVEANIMLGHKPDARAYHIGTQILKDLGVSHMELLTNNPHKIHGLEEYGLTVVRRIPLEVAPNSHNRRYLTTKRDKLGHLLH